MNRISNTAKLVLCFAVLGVMAGGGKISINWGNRPTPPFPASMQGYSVFR